MTDTPVPRAPAIEAAMDDAASDLMCAEYLALRALAEAFDSWYLHPQRKGLWQALWQARNALAQVRSRGFSR